MSYNLGSLVVTAVGMCDCGCGDSALRVESITALVEGYIFTNFNHVFNADTLIEVGYEPKQGTANDVVLHNRILDSADPRAEYQLLFEEYNSLKTASSSSYKAMRMSQIDARLDELECLLYGSNISKLGTP